MTVLGIDPGLAHCGWGVVSSDGNRYRSVGYGDIKTVANTPLSERLSLLYGELCGIIKKHDPELVSVEDIYMKKNITSAIAVSHARGVILLAASRSGATVLEYLPKEIKQSVVGYGQADKNQVQAMTALLLKMEEPPRPDHAADALAAAVTALNHHRF